MWPKETLWIEDLRANLISELSGVFAIIKNCLQTGQTITLNSIVCGLRLKSNPFQSLQDCIEFRLEHRVIITKPTGTPM